LALERGGRPVHQRQAVDVRGRSPSSPRGRTVATCPAEEDAHRELIRIAARATGSRANASDYFRLHLAGTRDRMAELADADELSACRSTATRRPYLSRDG
jgi:uncharacterized protein YcaQ